MADGTNPIDLSYAGTLVPQDPFGGIAGLQDYINAITGAGNLASGTQSNPLAVQEASNTGALGVEQLRGTGAENVANINAAAQNYAANAGLGGTIAGGTIARGGNLDVARTDLMARALAQGISNQPQMQDLAWRHAIYNSPLMQAVRGQSANAFGNILGGGQANAAPGSGGAGGSNFGLPAGAGTPAQAPIPTSIMNGGQAQGLVGQATNNNAATTQDIAAALAQPGSSALNQQLGRQAVAQGQGGLMNAAQNFQQSLLSGNAQQALTGAQTAEQQRQNYLQRTQGQQQVGNATLANAATGTGAGQ